MELQKVLEVFLAKQEKDLLLGEDMSVHIVHVKGCFTSGIGLQ